MSDVGSAGLVGMVPTIKVEPAPTFEEECAAIINELMQAWSKRQEPSPELISRASFIVAKCYRKGLLK
jgi:hypothetical protein